MSVPIVDLIIALTITFILTLICGPIFIPILTKLKFGQTVRDDGPQTHLIKTGTPTMGGIIFLLPILVTCVVMPFVGEYNKMLAMGFVTIGFGLIGFVDDYIKVVKKSKDGLNPKQKMFGLLLIATIYAAYLRYYVNISTSIDVPFTNFELDLKFMFIPFVIIFLLATTNAVNITDGLDGLASGNTLIVMVFFVIVGFVNEQFKVQGLFSLVIAAGCFGFLFFNKYPAKVFMGDTGSLALGGAIAAVAIMMKLELIILIVGAIYVAEAASVILQVAYFKKTQKRIFKMAPLHHHFELSGWKETKIVFVFWSITVILCIIGFLAL